MTRKTRKNILKFISALVLIGFVICGGTVIESLSANALSMENPYFVLSLLFGGWLALMIWLTN